MPDIDVDGEQLQNFIRTFEQFQEDISTRMKSVDAAWARCQESWRGDTATQFTQRYEQTAATVTNAQKNGDDVLQWLRRYYDIVREFDNL